MPSLNKTRIVLAAACLFLFTVASFAQSSISSPYSHYGIGDINCINNVRFKSMGSVAYGMRGFYNVNPQNPASYTSFDSLSFVFEGAFHSNFSTLKTTGLSDQAASAGLSYLYFGFPVTKWLKMSFGAMPFSTVGYKILDEFADPAIGRANYYYEGDGGLNQYYIGAGFKLSENLSVGANLIYLAGKLERSRLLNFPDSVEILNTRVKSTFHISDFSYSIGIQYHKKLNKNTTLTIGGVAGNGNKLSATQERLSETLFGGIDNSYEIFKDTIEYVTGMQGNMTLPLFVGGGFTYEKTDKLTVGADFSYGFWENYRIFDQTDSLKNSFRLNAGAEFIPDNSSISKYWQKLRYRAGFTYNQTYLNLKDNMITDLGFAFGIGLPLRRQAATLNFGAEIGSRGTTKNNLIQENYFRFHFGVSITERWFIKRKYN